MHEGQRVTWGRAPRRLCVVENWDYAAARAQLRDDGILDRRYWCQHLSARLDAEVDVRRATRVTHESHLEWRVERRHALILCVVDVPGAGEVCLVSRDDATGEAEMTLLGAGDMATVTAAPHAAIRVTCAGARFTALCFSVGYAAAAQTLP